MYYVHIYKFGSTVIPLLLTLFFCFTNLHVYMSY